MNFFKEPPAISWTTWLKRRIWSQKKEMVILPPKINPIQSSPTGLKPTRANPNSANEYSNFLLKYYSSNTVLDIYPIVFENALKNELTGVEIRDKKDQLVGLVFCAYMGLINNQKAGLITWLCVRPDWRKKGITDSLLHAIQNISSPIKIHFFRNDGWMKSPLPPLWTDAKIVRGRVMKYTTSVKKVSLQSKKDIIIDSWKKQNPEGILLDDPTIKSTLIEVWEYLPMKTLLIIQPSFEMEQDTKKHWCEVLHWVCENTYSHILSLEAIIDALPYNYIEAPSRMPHLDGWKTVGQTSWCVHGLDPGSPVLRPVLSLIAN